MNEVLRRSVSIYQKLLVLYPSDLRRDFGDEMVLAFADDLHQAWGDARLAGVAQIWWYAIRELLTVALPGQRSNRYLLSPALAFAAVALPDTAFLWLAAHPISHMPALPITWSDLLAVFSAGLLNALVAFIVTCFYARCSMNLLRLIDYHAQH